MVSRVDNQKDKGEEVVMKVEESRTTMSSSKKNPLEQADSASTLSNKRMKRCNNADVHKEQGSNRSEESLEASPPSSQTVDEFELASAVALASLANAACSSARMDEDETCNENKKISPETERLSREAAMPEMREFSTEVKLAKISNGSEDTQLPVLEHSSGNNDGTREDDDSRDDEQDSEATTANAVEPRNSKIPLRNDDFRESENMRGSSNGRAHFRTGSKEEDVSVASAVNGDGCDEPAPVTPEKRMSFPFTSAGMMPSSGDTSKSSSSANHHLRRVHFAPGVKKEHVVGMQHLYRGGPSAYHHHYRNPHHHQYQQNSHPHSHAQMIQRLQLPSSPGSNGSVGTSPGNSPKRILAPHHARAYLAFPPSASASFSSTGTPRVLQMDHSTGPYQGRVHSWPPPHSGTLPSPTTNFAQTQNKYSAGFMPPPTRILATSSTPSNLSPGGATNSVHTKNTPNPNSWVCDYCQAASFATYEEACVHEETCEARHSTITTVGDSPHSPKSPSSLSLRSTADHGSSLRQWFPPSVRGTPLLLYPPKNRAVSQLRSHHAQASGAFLPFSHGHSPYSHIPVRELPPGTFTTSQHTVDRAVALHLTPVASQWFTGCISLEIPQRDPEWLPELQCFIRKTCLEAFSAHDEDVATARKARIAANQVGIRCKFCKPRSESRLPQTQNEEVCFAAFPTSLAGIYESSMRWYKEFSGKCHSIPAEVATELNRLQALEEDQRPLEQNDLNKKGFHEKDVSPQRDRRDPKLDEHEEDDCTENTTAIESAGESDSVHCDARPSKVTTIAASGSHGKINDDSENEQTKSISIRQYWVDSAKALGMVDTLDGIRFGKDPRTLQPNIAELDASMKFLKTKGGCLISQHGKVSFDYHDFQTYSQGKDDASLPPYSTQPEQRQPRHYRNEDDDQQQDSNGDHIVQPNDMGIVPPYVYFLMRQVENCRFTEADRFVARSKGPVGYPGFQCRHCHGHAGLGKYFPVSSKSLSTNSTSQNIHAHLLKCRSCPVSVKSQLIALKEEKAKAPRLEPGWRKVFFDKIWSRLHGCTSPEGESTTVMTATSTVPPLTSPKTSERL